MWLELQVVHQEMKASQEQLLQSHKLQVWASSPPASLTTSTTSSGPSRSRQLLKRYVTAPELVRSINLIEQAALDGAETVRRIQRFSRSQSDEPMGDLDLGEIVRDSIEFTRGRWFGSEEKPLGKYLLKSEIIEVPLVIGNASELREVVTNLITNALDAMPPAAR